jgi:hypothetical protein
MSLNFKNLDVASLDYTDIVNSMTTFLKQEPSLADLDYDNKASAVSMLVNILATATAYNGIYAQLGYKESFLSTANLLSSVVGLASNSSVLLEVKKSAQTTRNMVVYGSALPAYSAFPALTTTGQSVNFYNTETVSPYTTDATLTLFSGSKVEQYTTWDFNTNSIKLPLTIDPETINLYSTDTGGNETIWTRVSKSDQSLTSLGYYYTVVNTVNGYLVTANLPTSIELDTSYTFFARAVVSDGALSNYATLYGNSYSDFITTEDPLGGYDELSVDLAKAKVQFDSAALHRCVTLSDFESAIMASEIDGTDDIDNITVANADQPSTVKIYVDGLSTANQSTLMTYLAQRTVAGTNIIYSL